MREIRRNQSKWLEISVTTSANTITEVSSIFNKYGYGGAIVEEWPHDSGEKTFVAKALLPINRSIISKKSHLAQDLKQLKQTVKFEERTLGPGQWLNEWKKYFDAFEIGEKCIIKPSWQSELPFGSTKHIIELDPGMAFGTGLHATTRLTYLGLEKYLKPGMVVLDLGTGSGILAIAAAKLGAGSVLALDIDPVAVNAAEVNIVRNNVSDIVQVKKGTLNKTTSKRLKEHFDLVLANITASVISDLAEYFPIVLKSGGILIASGINNQGLDQVLIKLTIVELNVVEIRSEGEWHAVVATKKPNE